MSAEGSPGHGPYLAVSEQKGTWWRQPPARPLPHAARTLAALVAQANGVSWRPLASPRPEWADETLLAARCLSKATAEIGAERSSRRRPRPVIAVTGPTGAGKSTVGAHLAATLEVPAIELGVLMRLLCLRGADRSGAPPGAALWRWARRGRLDFAGVSSQAGLAAALPRLDGASAELAMWREVEGTRLAALAREPEVQEVLAELARDLATHQGVVIVGRAAPLIEGGRTLRLDASPVIRVRRKRAQLAGIGLEPVAHDWFDPEPFPDTSEIIDTGSLDPAAMCMAALRGIGTPEAASFAS